MEPAGPPTIDAPGPVRPSEQPNALHHYATVLRRRWRWIALGLVVGLLAGVASTFFDQAEPDATTYYRATNTLIYDGGDPSTSDTSLPGATAPNLAQAAFLVRSADVADGVSSAIGVTVSDVNDKVNAVARSEVQAIDVTAISTDPDQAVLLADTTARVLNNYVGTTFTTLQTATAVQINGNAYRQRLQANRDARGGAPVVTTTPSTGSETDLSTGTTVSDGTRVAIGLATGLVLGLITAFVVEAWDDRLRRRERVEEVTGLPVLAEVPAVSKKHRQVGTIVASDFPRSAAAERYRTLRTSVLFALRHEATPADRTTPTDPLSVPVVMVTSPNPGDGKTTTAANLAASLAAADLRVLVIDCDHHKPSVGKYLDPVLEFDRLLEPARTRIENVWFIPPPKVGGKASSDVASQLVHTIHQWRGRYDLVVLDTPPMLTMNDALDLISEVDTVVLVMRAGQTRVGQAARAANLLGRFHADVLGVVLNACNARDTEQSYGYGYGYYGDEVETKPRFRRRTRGDAASAATDDEPVGDSPRGIDGGIPRDVPSAGNGNGNGAGFLSSHPPTAPTAQTD